MATHRGSYKATVASEDFGCKGNRPPRIAQLELKRTCPAHMTGLL